MRGERTDVRRSAPPLLRAPQFGRAHAAQPRGSPYTLTEFAIRVHSLAECRQPAADVADDHMTRSVAPWASSDEASLARTLAEIPRDVPSLVALARDGRAPGDAVGDAHPGPRDEPAWFCTPWLNRYAARLDRTLMFAEHESVDHPAGMIVAVSADHPDPSPSLEG